MAQYGLNRYGISYYGYEGANCANIESYIINAGYNISTNVDVELRAKYSKIYKIYYATDKIFMKQNDSDWTVSGNSIFTNKNGSMVYVFATGANFTINYYGEASVYIEKFDSNTGNWQHIKTVSLPNTSTSTTSNIIIENFASYKFTITAINSLQINYINCRVTNVEAKIRSGNNESDVLNSDYSVASKKETIEYANDVLDKFNVNIIQGKSHYQFDIIMMCSDDSVDMYLKNIEVETLDNELYVKESTYEICTEMPNDFKEYVEIDWDSVEPSGTKIEIRTATVDNQNSIAPLSPIYEKGKNHVRLQKGKQTGYFVTKEINNIDDYIESINKVISSYGFNGNNSTTLNNIYYKILMFDGTQYVELPQMYKVENYNINISMRNKFKIKYLFNNKNAQTEYTPYISGIKIVCGCNYSEQKSKNFTISSVEQDVKLCNISDMNFKFPVKDIDIELSIETVNSEKTSSFLFYNNNRLNKIINFRKNENPEIFVFSKLPILYAIKKAETKYDSITNKLIYEEPLLNVFDNGLITIGKQYKYKVINGIVEISEEQYKYNINNTNEHTDIKFKLSDSIYTEIQTINGNQNNDTITISSELRNIYTIKDWKSAEIFSDYITINNGNSKQDESVLLYLPAIENGVYVDDKDLTTFTKIDDMNYKIGPYTISILKNSIKHHINKNNYVDASDECIKQISIKSINILEEDMYKDGKIRNKYIYIDKIYRGAFKDDNYNTINIDKLNNCFVKTEDVICVTTYDPTGKDPYSISTQFIKNVDFIINENNSEIVWISNNKPNEGTFYYVVYGVKNLFVAEIVLSSDYKEIEKNEILWKSNVTKKIPGICSDKHDFVIEDLNTLYPKPISNIDTTVWADIDKNVDVSTIQYVIDDIDNKLVSASINGNKLICTMNGQTFAGSILPIIKPGFYYIGKDEYYLYSSKKTIYNNPMNYIMQNCIYHTTKHEHEKINKICLLNEYNNIITNSNLKIRKIDKTQCININEIV